MNRIDEWTARAKNLVCDLYVGGVISRDRVRVLWAWIAAREQRADLEAMDLMRPLAHLRAQTLTAGNGWSLRARAALDTWFAKVFRHFGVTDRETQRYQRLDGFLERRPRSGW